jgi:elongation factor P--(R)-beta-lysine ligase
MHEVHTPILSHDTVIDRHIDPIVVAGAALGLPIFRDTNFFLQTSPEFGMKRLLAAGMQHIYQISPVFRAGERGQFHNPEFTMVEWYRAGEGLSAAVEFLSELVRDVAGFESAMVETYQAVFLRLVDCDPLNCGLMDLTTIAQRFELNVELNWSDSRDDWLDLLFAEVIQPQLGRDRPTIVTHYPATQSALARICKDDPRTSERFELFINGVELANGYHELLDGNELEQRNRVAAAQRIADGKPALPIHNFLVDAMHAGLPACSGCALGLDRLLMTVTHADSIEEVISFPIETS